MVRPNGRQTRIAGGDTILAVSLVARLALGSSARVTISDGSGLHGPAFDAHGRLLDGF
jgi:hypothetical protein